MSTRAFAFGLALACAGCSSVPETTQPLQVAVVMQVGPAPGASVGGTASCQGAPPEPIDLPADAVSGLYYADPDPDAGLIDVRSDARCIRTATSSTWTRPSRGQRARAFRSADPSAGRRTG